MPSAKHRRTSRLITLTAAALVLTSVGHSAAQRRTSPARHRTPFIIPISPPQFGETQRPEFELTKLDWSETERLGLSIHSEAPQERLLVDSLLSEWLVELPSPQQLSELTPARVATTIAQVQEPRTVNVGVVGPNLMALADRITNHNLTLAALEDQLDARDFWTVADLEFSVSQLQQLSRDRAVWSMYVKLLNEKDHRRVAKGRSLSRCIELLQQRIFEASVTLEVKPFAVSNEPDEAEAKLQAFSKALDELSSGLED